MARSSRTSKLRSKFTARLRRRLFPIPDITVFLPANGPSAQADDNPSADAETTAWSWDDERWATVQAIEPLTPAIAGAWGSGISWFEDFDNDGQVVEDPGGWGTGGWYSKDIWPYPTGGWARLMPLLWDLDLPPSRRYNAPGPLRSLVHWVSHGWDESREAWLARYHARTGGSDDDFQPFVTDVFARLIALLL
ncbi:hypothetical protein B0H11DRAFT_2249072 [Mycena galericulata]|nr:hypothetical protein B0H11DRAFT_2249072 [Mycena galericulata]